MNKTEKHLWWAAMITGVCTFSVGFMFGVPTWAKFPENYAYDIMAGVATLLAAIATIAGAYFVATKQRRDDKVEQRERALFYIGSLHDRLQNAVRIATGDTFYFNKFEMEMIELELEQVRKIPNHEIPVEILGSFYHFVSRADETMHALQQFVLQKTGLHIGSDRQEYWCNGETYATQGCLFTHLYGLENVRRKLHKDLRVPWQK